MAVIDAGAVDAFKKKYLDTRSHSIAERGELFLLEKSVSICKERCSSEPIDEWTVPDTDSQGSPGLAISQADNLYLRPLKSESLGGQSTLEENSLPIQA
jgi:hypothetical protein